MDLDLTPPATPPGYTDFQIDATNPLSDVYGNKFMRSGTWDDPTISNGLDPFFTPDQLQYTYHSAMLPISGTPEQPIPPDDWLTWPGLSTEHTPPLVKHSMETLLRVMKTWPHILAKGFTPPPIIHAAQIDTRGILQPLRSCIAVAKSWSAQTPETTSIVQYSILREMRILFQSYLTLDEQQLLSAVQALAFYTVMLMYPSSTQLSLAVVDPAIFDCIAKVVSYVAKTGLMLSEEHDNMRPSWESWVHVTSKRRAVMSLYLLHWSYAVYHSLDSFACAQLGFMLAPAPKFLWQCNTRQEWESLYGKWLQQWNGYPYMMSGFAGIVPGTGLDRRTEMWLEDADELGMMFFSIVGATDRGRDAWDFGKGIAVLE
jgi:hypothetical protein